MAVDCFLYLEDASGDPVQGECTDVAFLNTIEVFKFDFDAVSQVEPDKMLGDTVTAPKKKGGLIEKGVTNGDMSGEPMRSNTAVIEQAKEEQTGKDSFTFSIEKYMDKSSPVLFDAFCLGTSKEQQDPSFKHAIIYVLVGGMKRSGDSDPASLAYLMIEFGNLRLTQYQMKYADGLIDEKLTFWFDWYTMTYRKQETGGGTASDKITIGYDFIKLKKLP